MTIFDDTYDRQFPDTEKGFCLAPFLREANIKLLQASVNICIPRPAISVAMLREHFDAGFSLCRICNDSHARWTTIICALPLMPKKGHLISNRCARELVL